MTSRLPTMSITTLILTCAAASTPAATIGVIGNVSWQPTPGGGNATLSYGTNIAIDPISNPYVRIDIAVRASEGDHQGVANIVYDITSPEAKSKGYFLDAVNPEGNIGAYRAHSGYNNMVGPPALHDISAPSYDYAQPSPPLANYGGGWGFPNSGLPHQGATNSIPGSIFGAGDSLPLTWSGDLAPTIPGNQTYARIGVGQGAYTAAPEDPVLAGESLGFGSDVANGIGGGDGSWWFHSIFIELFGWDRQTYTFFLTPTAGSVLNSNADLTQPLGGGFRQAVVGGDLVGSEVSFTLIPEPALSFVLLGALTLIRRR